MRTMTRPGLVGGGALALALAWGPWSWTHTGLAGHMLQHFVVMNVAAPLFAAALRLRVPSVLAIATGLQVALLWGWHLPVLFDAARHDLVLAALMQVSLFVVSLLFWSAVITHPRDKSWQTIFALLITAKALCLFGAILCFARGTLYAGHGEAVASALDDQQLAGLLMMASCALIYVAASIILFVRWMASMEQSVPWTGADA